MPSIPQHAFNGGAIDPKITNRKDQARVAYGVATMLNFVAEVGGAVSNRAGTEFLAEVNHGTADTLGESVGGVTYDGSVRLIPFLTGDSGNFMLEFGHIAQRVWQNGAIVTVTGDAWNSGTTYSIGEIVEQSGEVYISVKDSNLNNDPDDEDFLTTYGVYWYKLTSISSGVAHLEVRIGTFRAFEVFGLGYAQSDGVQTFVHPSDPPIELKYHEYLAPINGIVSTWRWDVVDFLPDIDAPTGLSASAGGAGSNTYRYRVTAYKRTTREESLVGVRAALTITDVTAASPRVVTTSASHGLLEGDEVLIDGTGLTDLDGVTFKIGYLTGTTFNLIDTTAAGTSATGSVTPYQVNLASAATPTNAAPHTVSWTAVADADSYVIYRSINGVYGFIGISEGTSFEDVNYTPDTTDTPPIGYNPFEDAFATAGYPRVVAYFQQRRAFGSTVNEPQRILLSRTGRPNNFTVSNPIKDDDAIDFSLASSQTRRITAMIEIGRLLALSSGAEWSIDGDNDGAITPSTVRARQQSYEGASSLPALPIGSSALYVGDRTGSVREISYDLQAQGERSKNLSTWAAHFLRRHTIVEWAYQRVPESIVWMVRDDGILLGMTYHPDQQVVAWHEHDVGGTVESVCVIPEDDRDVVYLVVRRTIDGNSVQYIERLGSREFDSIEDACFLDSSIVWDGNHTGSTTMTLTTGGGWTIEDDLTLTASASDFVAGDVGQQRHLYVDGVLLRVDITAYTSATVVTVRADRTVEAAFQGVAVTVWAAAHDYIDGLDHLEGKTVGILGDGFEGKQAVVTSGTVALDFHARVIRAGLPITARLETLDIDDLQNETLIDKQMRVNSVGVVVADSRAFWVGPDVDHLKEWKQRQGETMDEPVDLFTGLAEVSTTARWGKGGRVTIEQRSPLPLTITGIIRSGEIGGK